MDKATPTPASVDSVMALFVTAANARASWMETGFNRADAEQAEASLRAEVERLAAQAAPSEPQIDSRFPAAHYGHDLQPSQAPVVQAVQPTQAVRMLTDDEQAAIIDMHSTGRAQGDHECAEAIQRKFCEVNKLPAPSDGEIGGA